MMGRLKHRGSHSFKERNNTSWSRNLFLLLSPIFLLPLVCSMTLLFLKSGSIANNTFIIFWTKGKPREELLRLISKPYLKEMLIMT